MFHSARSALGRVVAAGAALAAAACGGLLEDAAYDNTPRVMQRARGAMEQEPDLEIARAALPAGLKQVEGFYVARPDDRTLQVLLASGFCGYAGLLHDDWEQALAERRFAEAEDVAGRAAGLYLRCTGYATRLLGAAWARALPGGEPELAPLVARATRRDVPGLLWAAMGILGAAQLQSGDLRLLGHMGKAERMLERVIELDEGHERGLAHVLLGSVLCGRPAALGGDPAGGRRHLERAAALADGMFLARVMNARHCAVARQDRAAFVTLLGEVAGTPAARWPDVRLANELAQRKARRYLRQVDELF